MGLFDDLIGAAKKAAENAARSAARSAGNQAKNAAENAVKDAGRSAVAQMKTKKIALSALPGTLAELQAMPEAALTDPFAVAALTAAVMTAFPKDREGCFAMINFLRGPRPMSPMDEAFIRDRFMDGKDYIPRSHFDGATPENDYTPALPYTVTVQEGAHSRDQEKEGYLTLYLTSGGADNVRPVTLRNKPSTGQWFLWEYSSLLSTIRIPKSQDAWA
ncbi:MAG: hypothetical protein II776_01735 [Clostridia bacterium]|nr:hypothetical protein [Clostridia bacterium]